MQTWKEPLFVAKFKECGVKAIIRI